MMPLALIGWLGLSLASARESNGKDAPVSPDLSNPTVRRQVQLDVLSGLVQAGMYDDALRVAGDLRGQGVVDERLDTLQARAMTAKGLRTESITLLQGTVKKHPRNVDAWSQLGLLYADVKDLPRSIDALEHAKRLSPNDAAVLNNLGYVTMATGRLDRAIELFHQALVLNPSMTRARNNLGFAYARDERDMEALDAFRGAGSESDARYNLGVACEMRHDLAGALTQYHAALEAQPSYAKASQALARLSHQGSP